MWTTLSETRNLFREKVYLRTNPLPEPAVPHHFT
jgi:hypothetical protein